MSDSTAVVNRVSGETNANGSEPEFKEQDVRQVEDASRVSFSYDEDALRTLIGIFEGHEIQPAVQGHILAMIGPSMYGDTPQLQCLKRAIKLTTRD